MTVCIAAIADRTIIWGASDRMITRGQLVEHEAVNSKSQPVDSHVAVMFAGDVALQTEIIAAVKRRVASFRSAQKSIPKVENVVEMYEQEYQALRRRHLERAFLSPFGLTTETFISNQKALSEMFVSDTRREMITHGFAADAIVAGFDGEPHIWTVVDGTPRCEDHEGFAAIGSGAEDALTEFERVGQSPNMGTIETQFMVYLAKKSAERIAGVGPGTDMFGITFLLSGFQRMGPDYIKRLDNAHRRYAKRLKRALAGAFGEGWRYVREQLKRGDEIAKGLDRASLNAEIAVEDRARGIDSATVDKDEGSA